MTTSVLTKQPRAERSLQHDRRQSLRVPLSVPLIVSDPKSPGVSECCETVEANGHGCQVRSSRPLETGTQVRLDTVYVKNRTVNATVIHSEPLGLQEARAWNCGLVLDTPGNFWGIPSPPQDWPAADYSGRNEVASFSPTPSERRSMPAHTEPLRDLAQLPQGGQQMILNAIDERIAGLETRVEKALAELETGTLTRLQQSFGEAIRQGQERMKHFANACGESRLVNLEAELERRLEPFLTRSQAAINDLERLLNVLRQEQAAWEAQRAQQHQQDGARHLQNPVDLRLQQLSESLRREERCQ